MGLVSVIIPSYNSARLVGGAIESVLAQTLYDFEVIVVDDGSKDDTPQAVEPYLADSRIQYFRQENRGLPGARNAGAKVSRGEYLVFLDADDFLAPNALEAMRKRFEESGAAWLNVGLLKLEGENRTTRHPRLPEGDLLLAILDDDFITRSPFYPRKEFFEIGMYDEEIRMREDWDINIRMIAAGKPFVLLDETLYLYTRTEGSITTSNLHKLFFYTEKLLRKHHKSRADSGSKEVSKLYASNMWLLAHRYFYDAHDSGEAFRCVLESMRYDMNFCRLFHPLIHRIELLFGKT
jgi:glycosyltransferase involved in cell wall biosynthesis